MADQNENKVEVVARESGLSKALDVGKKIVLGLVLLAGSVVAAQESGLVLPPVVLHVAQVVIAIGAALGIASSGLKPKQGESLK